MWEGGQVEFDLGGHVEETEEGDDDQEPVEHPLLTLEDLLAFGWNCWDEERYALLLMLSYILVILSSCIVNINLPFDLMLDEMS